MSSYLNGSAELDLTTLLDELRVQWHQMSMVVVQTEVEQGELLLLVIVQTLSNAL